MLGGKRKRICRKIRFGVYVVWSREGFWKAFNDAKTDYPKAVIDEPCSFPGKYPSLVTFAIAKDVTHYFDSQFFTLNCLKNIVETYGDSK